MEEPAAPSLARGLIVTVLFGAVSAVVGYFLKLMLEAWGVLDPLARAFGLWLHAHVSASQAGWAVASTVALGLWAILLWRAPVLFLSGVIPSSQAKLVPTLKREPARVDKQTRQAALQALIEAIYDARYLLRDHRPRVVRQMLIDPFYDTPVYRQTSGLPPSTPLSQVLGYMAEQGLLEAGQLAVTAKIREDWDKLVPSAKLSIFRLSRRHPFLGLDDLPPPRADEQEVANIKWPIADALFGEVWAAYTQRMLDRGFDLDKREIVWTDFPADVKFYAIETGRVIKSRIEIDTALVEASLTHDYHRVENAIRARARRYYETMLVIVNEICESFPDPPDMIRQISRPIQEQVDPLLENPMGVGTTPQWIKQVTALMA